MFFHPKDARTKKAEYDTFLQQWKRSPAYADLRKVFQKQPAVPIRKIVCFALGSLDIVNNESPASFIQHAAAAMFAAQLGKPGHPLKVFAQDPLYRQEDEEVLRSIGITAVADPQGFLEVDESSLVISILPNIPVRQIIADLGTRPAAIIWSTHEGAPDRQK